MKKIRRYLNGLSHAVYPEMCYSHLPANLRKQMVSIATIESRKKTTDTNTTREFDEAITSGKVFPRKSVKTIISGLIYGPR